MKLLSVVVENYRILKHAGVVFDPSRTVVGGNQEFGKSTLVEAIHNAFFLKCRGAGAPHKAMRSDLHVGHPTVTLGFETGGRKYTIKKTFAATAATARADNSCHTSWSTSRPLERTAEPTNTRP